MNRVTVLLILAMSSLSLVANQEPFNLIEKVTVEKNKITIIVHSSFAHKYLRSKVFFSHYDDDVDLTGIHDSVAIIPFLTSIIPAIWISGQHYQVDQMDEDLYESFRVLKRVFNLFYPFVKWSGELTAKTFVKNTPRACQPEEDTVLLFSGGLDAVASSFLHLDKKQLLITIRGCDIKLAQHDMWAQVQKKCREFALEYGHSNSFIQSNFTAYLNQTYLSELDPAIVNWWGQTLQGLSYTGLTAPLLVIKGHKHLMIASTRTGAYPYPYGTHPLIDNNIRFAGISVAHDGADLTRLDKIQVISAMANRYKVAVPRLRVCWGKDKEGGNCGKCEKCLRTINEILAEGQGLKEFGFNVSLEQAIEMTRNHFSHPISITGGLLWHWQCIQNRINYVLESKDSGVFYSEPLKSYLQWLSQINLDATGAEKVKQIVRDQQKLLLSHLWKLGQDRSTASLFNRSKKG